MEISDSEEGGSDEGQFSNTIYQNHTVTKTAHTHASQLIMRKQKKMKIISRMQIRKRTHNLNETLTQVIR